MLDPLTYILAAMQPRDALLFRLLKKSVKISLSCVQSLARCFFWAKANQRTLLGNPVKICIAWGRCCSSFALTLGALRLQGLSCCSLMLRIFLNCMIDMTAISVKPNTVSWLKVVIFLRSRKKLTLPLHCMWCNEMDSDALNVAVIDSELVKLSMCLRYRADHG